MTPHGPAEPPDDIEDADPGLARARTELAWTRSSIAFAALGAAILKFRPALGAPILVFSVVVWSVGHVKREEAGTAGRRVLLVTVAITLLAVVAAVLAILGNSWHGIRF
jgi:uncharacterized membrane protein YidH (DUF202 family)